MGLSSKRIDDVETLRAFAHPLRMKLLGRLRTAGSATASELGRHFGESSGSTSYHLRQLERFGFVVEDDEQLSRRERRWRAAHDVTSWHAGDFADSEAGRAAEAVVGRAQLGIMLDRLERWRAERHEWGREWLDAAGHSDMMLFARPEDLRALTEELEAVITRYVENPRLADDPDAAQVSLHLLTIPARDAS
ncbi:helix-turn-helix domain-containing protein [Jiangella asiatica]|uniref:ArsR family transcriptional regulator n=1 Tax=Jiangella asiatica TaxID=2530372 RepID=A0A4R5CQ94_9ACTN|nr:helix-turn-helix domain-containing protein [Jiangella asiatica]TDE01607.1 ArsR family transcriptional regulator [Jiangella asiatica]